MGRNLVNEIKGGWQWSPVDFFGNVTRDMFSNQGGFNLDLDNNTTANTTEFSNISSPTASNTPQPRNTVNWSIDSTLNWLKGRHSINLGGMFHRMDSWNKFRQTVPTVTFGMGSTDPALGMFNATNFPGASAAQLTAARNMYALLTGRVTQTSVLARIDAASGKYVYAGLGTEESRLDNWGLFAQDSWRMRPNLSLSLGVRWDIQAPFRARPRRGLHGDHASRRYCAESAAWLLSSRPTTFETMWMTWL